MKRILNIWLPNWPIQRLLAARPELRGSIVILHARDPRRGSCVTACCHHAEQKGVRWSMPIAEVAALFSAGQSRQKFPVTYEIHDGKADLEALVELAQWCEQFTPHVGLEPLDHPYAIQVAGGRYKTVTAVESLILDVTRLSHLIADEQQLAEQVVQELQTLGYQVHIGLGNSLAASWLAARWLDSSSTDPIAALHDEAAADPLPLAALRLPEETLVRLDELGVREIGQLKQLPREALRARFGDVIGLRLDQLSGVADEVIHTHQPLPDFQVDWTLEPPTDRADVIEQVLHELVRQLTWRLHRHDLGVLKLDCELAGPGGPWSFQTRLFKPSIHPRHLLDLLLLQSESLVLPAPASRVRLSAVETAPLERKQAQLFTGQASSEWPQHLAQLVNRLSSRLGNSAVIRPRLQEDAQPEQAWYPLFWTSQSARSKRRGKPPASAAWRPLYLHPQPRLLQVQPPGSCPPKRFLDRGRFHEVAQSWGPERIETGWWRGHSIRRDYYRVETTTGNRFWLFQHLEDQRWFLHGEYV